MKNKSWYVWVSTNGHRELHVFSVLRRPYHRLVMYSNPMFAMHVQRKEAAFALSMARRNIHLEKIEKVVTDD